MKKSLCFFLCLALMLTLTVPTLADEAFEPVKLRIVSHGNAAGNFRLVADLESIPFEVDENTLAGCKIAGTWTHKTTGEKVSIESVVLANEMRQNRTVIVVKPTATVTVQTLDFSTSLEYTFDFTLSYAEKDKTSTAAPVTAPANADYKPDDDSFFAFITAKSFATNLGTWSVSGITNGSALDVLLGKNDGKAENCQPAALSLNVEEDGTYFVWANGLDFAENQPATRFFSIAVNGNMLPENGGTHKTQGWAWQKLGSVELKAGENKLELVDSSAFYARCQAIIVTDDEDLTPPTAKQMIPLKPFGTGSTAISNKPTNKLGSAVMLYIGSEKAYVLGSETTVDKDNVAVKPFTENGRTLVPVRFIAESFGAKVDWDSATQTVTVNADGKTISMVLGQSAMQVDGKTVALDTPANTYNDRTFIPLRAMVEAMGKNVFWDDRGLIIISSATFDAQADKELIDNAVAGFGGEIIDFAVVDEDLSAYQGTIGANDYMLTYFNPYELQERDGLVNVISKMKEGESVTIGFLGGSITMQDGWRGKTLEWLKAQYPNAKFREIDVSLSGTGADLAACRTDLEIVAYDPDLVFVEYAVNGGTVDNMEGIVRKIWKNNPKADICFVYTLTVDTLPSYAAGVLPSVPREFEKVAEYYGIPSIAFGFQIADFNENGKLTPRGSATESGKILFSNDGVHPTMDGSILYAGAVARSIATMDKHTSKTELEHSLKQPLSKTNWEDAKYYSYDKASFEGSWQEFEAKDGSYGADYPYSGGYFGTFLKLFPKMTGTKTPGSTFTVRFKGTTMAIFDLGGTYAGQLKVSVDGAEPYILNRHTPYSSRLRHQYAFIPELPYGEHTVTFTLDSQTPVKTAMSDYQSNKAEYDKNEFYLGAILVVGDIISD